MAHYQSMEGAWSFAFDPYYRENLTKELFNPKTHEVFDIEDMYSEYHKDDTILVLFAV